MWDLPRPGLEPVSPALAGRFLTTAPPGKPQHDCFKDAQPATRQLNEIRKAIPEQNEKVNKEIEIIKRSQREIMELKNTMDEFRNIIESYNSRLHQAEERIYELKKK